MGTPTGDVHHMACISGRHSVSFEKNVSCWAPYRDLTMDSGLKQSWMPRPACCWVVGGSRSRVLPEGAVFLRMREVSQKLQTLLRHYKQHQRYSKSAGDIGLELLWW